MLTGRRQNLPTNRFLDRSLNTYFLIMMRHFFYLILAICTAGFVVFGAVFLPTVQSMAVQQQSCAIGRTMVAQIENPRPSVTGDRPMQSFSLFTMPNSWFKLVGTEASGKCFDYIAQKTDHVTLTAFMPVELATDLVAQRWRKSSGQSIQAIIAASVTDRQVWLAPEDALALHHLGYQISSEAKVLTPLSPYQFTTIHPLKPR